LPAALICGENMMLRRCRGSNGHVAIFLRSHLRKSDTRRDCWFRAMTLNTGQPAGVPSDDQRRGCASRTRPVPHGRKQRQWHRKVISRTMPAVATNPINLATNGRLGPYNCLTTC
jgi:hypothetical protein